MVDLAGIGLVGGALSSIAGGIIGGSDAREAERRQLELLRQARSLYGRGRGALDDAESLAVESIDDANVILAGIEPDLLEGLDEQLRVRVAQQMIRQEQEAAMTNQRLAAGGLDATTVMPQVQRSQARAQGDAMGSLAAQFASQRASAIQSSRMAQAQGFNNLANTYANFGNARAQSFMGEANMLGGYQFQPANTGAAIGQIGGSLFGGLMQYDALQTQRNTNDQLAAFLRRGSTPTGGWGTQANLGAIGAWRS